MYRKFVLPYSAVDWGNPDEVNQYYYQMSLLYPNATAAGASGTGNSIKGLRQFSINNIIKSALETGDWSALADWDVTEAEVNKAISELNYGFKGDVKNKDGSIKTTGLTDAQKTQLADVLRGKYNNYGSSDSTTVVEENTGGTAGTDPRTESEAAKMLGATSSAGDQLTAYQQLLQKYNGIDSGYVSPQYTGVTDASVRDLATLQQQLGTNINYDYNAIRQIYDDATRSAYDIEQKSGVEKSYYQHLADAQNTALDTIRQQYGTAVANGATKGMMAAQQLSAILGTSATAGEEATQLAIDKQSRANEYASQMAQNAKDALNYSNQQQMDLATLSRQLYNDDIQAKTAELSYNQGINTDRANVAAARTTALGSLQASLANTAAGIYNNNQSAIAQLQSAIESANATKYAADRQRTTSGKGAVTT